MENNTEPKKTGLELLREPFPDHLISLLPKPTKKDAVKSQCNICGGWHGQPAVHLKYVGHAALTHRLLEADPMWSWEPLAFGSDGLPAFDKTGGLWIKLTVCGLTRFGYGHADSSNFKDAGAREKEVIGDALRNAAMRFGAALDLWHKGDLHVDDEPMAKTANPANQQQEKVLKNHAPGGDPVKTKLQEPAAGKVPWVSKYASEAQVKRMFTLASRAKWSTADVKVYLKECMNLTSTKDMNRQQFELLCGYLEKGISLESAKTKPHVYQS